MAPPSSDEDRNPSEEDLNPSIKTNPSSPMVSPSCSSYSDSPPPLPPPSMPQNGSEKLMTPEEFSASKRKKRRRKIPETPVDCHDSEPEKKLFDDSRKLFQRLWTDEDEIGLLNGFYEYSQKGTGSFHDLTPFYDQIKSSLQLDFNKNQLVEKLRRLKKKYRNVVNKMGAGKDFSFKSPHDQAAFEISKKIWSGGFRSVNNKNPSNHEAYGVDSKNLESVEEEERSVPDKKKLKRPRTEDQSVRDPNGIQAIVEDTVRCCLSPLFKEMFQCAVNVPIHSPGFGLGFNLPPLNGGGLFDGLNLGAQVDERWRKQQILELEVYSKRIELIQDQIKSTLETLKSAGK
ncbi:probable transcription factor At3g04930 [Amborella trichopoda]|uniref:Glabrous enhancer-binding protein-like DBD domain-containing protein n=1 Tax=Amborella trichopoda TaxID=13333 RepID=W1P298_AMBTC|nr:probable transcription factor At3g04930 [Amborella trichopoda]ERN02043.1 hypothetical protein AMTR_s00045p00124580 [Amborella trichopoda]|eukprot:XP_006840368.1 probable transcription factor At3g04930 [Amborella trichopoda]